MGDAMTKEELRKMRMQAQLNIEFRRTLTRKYELECKRDGIEPTFAGLLEFAERHALIRAIDVNRFMALDLYPKYLYENNGCKTKAVQELEEVVPVSDRTIWGWIDNLTRRYRKYRHGK